MSSFRKEPSEWERLLKEIKAHVKACMKIHYAQHNKKTPKRKRR